MRIFTFVEIQINQLVKIDYFFNLEYEKMTGIIIQARLGSTRLPKKMVLPFYENKGILEIILEKIKKNFSDVYPIIVATTNNPLDNEIEKICNMLSVTCFRGNEEDVLQRFIDTAQEYKITKIIRICADNPFIDMGALKQLIQKFEKEDLDYLSFQTSKGVPSILTHYGFWAEAVSLSSLIKVKSLTKEKLYYEHVTNYIYSHPNLFKILFIPINYDIEKYENIRMTLDTKEDFLLLKEIYEKLDKIQLGTIEDLLFYVSKNKNWTEGMSNQINFNKK